MCQKTNTLKQRIRGKLMLQELTLNYVIKNSDNLKHMYETIPELPKLLRKS